MLELEATARGADGPVVEVAVDAPGGPGPRTYTYLVPAELGELEPGEAVLVPFGQGRAAGDRGRAPAGGRRRVRHRRGAPPTLRPVAARIRSDGPLLPPLTLALAEWIGDRYLAPLATVIRAMLPPGMLERLELVAEVTPAGEARLSQPDPGLPAVELDLLDELAGRPRPVRDLSTPEGRAGLLRRLRALAAAGLVELTWTLLGAALGPRYERWLWITPAGGAAAAALEAGERVPGRPLGPRQRAALAELAAPVEVGGTVDPGTARAPDGGVPAGPVAERHGSTAIAGLVRRGLVRAEVRERPRRPLAGRPAGLRGARPPEAAFTTDQAAALRLVLEAVERGDPTPTLLDGVTGGGKTAIYVEAIAASLRAGRPALLLVPEIALATPIIDRLRADLPVRVAVVHSGLGEGERADEWRRIRAGDVDLVVGTRTALLAPLADIGLLVVDEEHEAAYKSDRTPRFQARDAALELGRLAGAAVVLGSATPSVETMGHARAGRYRRAVLPVRAAGLEPRGDRRRHARRADRRQPGAVLGRPLGRPREPRHRPRRPRDPRAQPPWHGVGRRVPRLRHRPALPGLRPSARLPPGGHDPPLPPLRPCVAARDPLPVVRLARGSAISAGARSGSSGRSATGSPRCASPASTATSWSARAPPTASSTTLPPAARTSSSGTSLVAKGLDVPEVTLVGVVSADIALNLPDERASERTYQLLAQAVGRAGRGDRRGIAFIQTYRPEHRAIRAVVEGDAAAFYDEELALRERFGSPPFGRLVKLTVGLPDREAAEREGLAMADRLRARAAADGGAVQVAGPAPAYVARRAEQVALQRRAPWRGPRRTARPAARPAVVRGRRPGESLL